MRSKLDFMFMDLAKNAQENRPGFAAAQLNIRVIIGHY
jgi:hypothetical protein